MEIAITGKHGVGKTMLIDDEDVALLQGKSVFMVGDMYPAIYLNGRAILVHKIVAEYIGLSGGITHENRNKLDNRRQNLRGATASQNGRNCGVRVDNTSGLKGISWCKSRGKWEARLRVDGRKENLGYFTCKFAAARAYDKRALEVDPIHAATNLSLGLLPESPNFLLS
jgi:AP2 domain